MSGLPRRGGGRGRSRAGSRSSGERQERARSSSYRTRSERDRFRPSPDRTYIAFNKPYGVLSQFTRPADSDKRCLADFDLPPLVYPVGRLDYDSEGLLLLTDDSRVNAALLTPAAGHVRTYLAQVENIPTSDALERLRHGVIVQGKMTLPAQVELLDSEPDLPARPVPIRFRKNIPTSWLKISLTEGRNRQVRRMTASVGLPTLRLVRIAIGRLELSDLNLAPGQWLEIPLDQLNRLFAAG